MASPIITEPAPVLNPSLEGYGSPNLTGASTQTYNDRLLAAQQKYEQALQDNNGNTSAPGVTAALVELQAIQAETVANFEGSSATSYANYANLGGAVGAGSELFGQVVSARSQQTLTEQRRSVNNNDWRVKLQLAQSADYLYKDPSIQTSDLLFPLKISDGIIFPYTPTITTSYVANYSPLSLTHSNYISYFYQGSAVNSIQLTCTFTAQDTNEANYLLAVIHFFKTATKMFYGQDAQAGAPPPLLYLSGFGANQFAAHPCVINTFNYVLPNDVDYVRAGSVNQNAVNLLPRRAKNSVPNNSFSSAISRLQTLGIKLGIIKGADPTQVTQSIPVPNSIGADQPTYVPTKMDITVVLYPVQTRSQVSKEFSVKAYANGNLLRGGYW